MMKRIKPHQLEDLSRYKFGLAIPEQWVFRDKDKDYGIDGEVEVFNSKEIATGIVFLVQLKATSSKQVRTIRGLDLSLKTIEYYKSLDLPVLIARYSKLEDKFYVKWAAAIDCFYAKDGAKTMRVAFSDSDILNEEKINEIKGYLTQLRVIKSGGIKLPINMSISFGSKNICSMASSILLSKIRSKLHSFNEILQLDNYSDSLAADIFIDESTLNVGFLDVARCILHDVASMDRSTLAEDLIKDICLALSIALSQLGYSDLAARIVFSNDLQCRLKIKSELLQYLLPNLLETNYFHEALDLVNEVCDNEDDNFLEIIANASLLFLRSTGGAKDRGKLNSIEIFLQKNSERCKALESSSYGIAQYNLGNFYRNTGRFKESVRCLLEARKYETKYYRQGYFYGNLAGSFFELDKFTFAADFYKKAIDLGVEKELRALYADSLMFSGQYQKSLDVFKSFLSDRCDRAAEWHLKAICLSSLMEEDNNVKFQSRNIKAALEFADVCSVSGEDIEIQLEKSLLEDLLCGTAWFNLGDYKNSAGEIEEAAFCFTMCSLIQRWDIESWVNATACSFSSSVPLEFFMLLVRHAYSCNGDKYIEAIYELFEDQLGIEGLSKISEIIEQIISIEPKSKQAPELRILNKDGKFKNIFATEDTS